MSIAGSRIISIDKPGNSNGVVGEHVRLIDCSGCIVAPGFIDMHSHSDLQVLENRTEKLLQGVTAEVVGNCGFSPYPLPEDPQKLRDFANGIFNGGASWGWDSAASYLASARQSKVATVILPCGTRLLADQRGGNNGAPAHKPRA